MSYYDDHDDDYDYNHYGDYDFGDDNLTFPNYFITCFETSDIPKYKAAIDRFVKEIPGTAGSLEIDMSGQWNSLQYPALLCWNRDHLAVFWKIFEEL